MITEANRRYAFGVYGYYFPSSLMVRGIELIPLYSGPELKSLALQTDALNLTGYGLLPADVEDLKWSDWDVIVSRLADAMTFCQQQWVLSSRFVIIDDGDFTTIREKFPSPLTLLFERRHYGPLITCDVTKHSNLIDKILSQIEIDPEGPIVKAFYRQIEVFRLANPVWEIQHFLAFTGLEILARKVLKKDDIAAIEREISVSWIRHFLTFIGLEILALIIGLISNFCKSYGFSVVVESISKKKKEKNLSGLISDLCKSNGFDGVTVDIAQNWADGRNESFHQGEYEFVRRGEKFNSIHHLYQQRTLLADLILRLIGFDDEEISWTRWRDRMPFGEKLQKVESVKELLRLLNEHQNFLVQRSVVLGTEKLEVREYSELALGRVRAFLPLSSQAAAMVLSIRRSEALGKELKQPLIPGTIKDTYVLANQKNS